MELCPWELPWKKGLNKSVWGKWSNMYMKLSSSHTKMETIEELNENKKIIPYFILLQCKMFIFRLLSCTQFRWSQFYWQHPKHHSQEPMYAFFSPAGLIRVLTLAVSRSQRFFSSCFFLLVLIAFDIHNEHKCTVVVCLFHGWLSSHRELNDGIVVKLVSPGVALLRIFKSP